MLCGAKIPVMVIKNLSWCLPPPSRLSNELWGWGSEAEGYHDNRAAFENHRSLRNGIFTENVAFCAFLKP